MTNKIKWTMNVKHITDGYEGDYSFKYFVILYRDGVEVWDDYYTVMPKLTHVVESYEQFQ